MSTNVLLIGRTSPVLEEARRSLQLGDDYEFRLATGLDDVRAAFSKTHIDHVIMGAGVDLETRLEIVREVFEKSDTTTVHMKARLPAAEGFLPFVRSVLAGLESPSL